MKTLDKKVTRQNISDEHLLDQIQKGNKNAFCSIYDKYAPSLYGIIYEITGQNGLLAEKLLHQAFCLIWQTAGQFNPARQRIFGWMISIARKVAAETVLTNSQIRTSPSYVDMAKKTDQPASKKSKNALELICFNGYSLPEAAKKLDICTQELKTNLRQELSLFREKKFNEKST